MLLLHNSCHLALLHSKRGVAMAHIVKAHGWE